MLEEMIRFPGRTVRRIRPIVRRLVWGIPRIEAGPAEGLLFDNGSATATFVTGDYELPVQRAVSSLVSNGAVFYDIGANVGFFSVLAGRLVGPSGAVCAFEPVPANASMVEKNARINGMDNIEVFRIAVSRRTGRSELFLAEYAGGAVLKGAGVPPDPAGSIMVETISIDELVSLRRTRPPDVVKIDVEGAELDVLQGMCNVLKEWRPKVVIEVDDSDEARGEEKMTVCREYLQDLRYRSVVLPNSYRDEQWYVRHIVAQPESRPEPGGIHGSENR